MNKNQITMASIGGVALFFLLVVAYLSFSTYSDQSTRAEELEFAKESVQRLNKAKVPPTEAAEQAIQANREKVAVWHADAMALATRGDRATRQGMNGGLLRQEMRTSAAELDKLPGGVNGVLVAENFGYGFHEIVRGGSQPEGDAAKLAKTLRQWEDVEFFANTLSQCGVHEWTGVTVRASETISETTLFESMPQGGKGRRKGSKKAVGKTEDATPVLSEQTYELKFTAKPAAFLRVLNAFATSERFVIVDQFSFANNQEAMMKLIGEKADQAAVASARKGRRSRRSALQEAAETEAATELAQTGDVIDPATAAPLTVTLVVTTIDFGSENQNEQPNEGQEDEQ